MSETPYITEEELEELRMRYDAERFYYITPNPELRLQFDADALHDLALTWRMDPTRLGEALGLSEEVIARASGN
jgi:hypothetical protein